MKSSNVLFGFLKFSISAKIAFYRMVIAKLTGNAYFINPDIPLKRATTAVDQLQTAFYNAQSGGSLSDMILKEKEYAADALFISEAIYVDRISQGNEMMILSSGYSASNELDETIVRLIVQSVNRLRSVRLSCNRLKGSRAFIWQISLDEGKTWIIAGYSIQNGFKFAALPIGSKPQFKVASINEEGATKFCKPVRIVIN